MLEFNADLLLELCQLQQQLVLSDPVPISRRRLQLERVVLQLGPRLVQLRVRSEERLGEDAVALVDAPVEEDGPHHGLEAVGHRVAQLVVVAEVRAVRVQHKLLQPENLYPRQNLKSTAV